MKLVIVFSSLLLILGCGRIDNDHADRYLEYFKNNPRAAVEADVYLQDNEIHWEELQYLDKIIHHNEVRKLRLGETSQKENGH